MTDICNIDDCGRPSVGRKMCQTHYSRYRKHGDPRAMLRATPVMNGPKICIFEECGEPSKSKGYCDKHYQRFWKHGDASTRLRAANGECMEWAHRHKDHMGEACLIWPYASGGRGDPVVGYNGHQHSACRVMCELAHGLPPTPKHEAAHNCGKAHEGCINPTHLRWATSSENKGDKVAHGTHTCGDIHPVSKITEHEALRILLGNERPCDLAKELGVTHSLIIRIRQGKIWKHLERGVA